MKMHPPALINKQVTEDMLHWMMTQPNRIVVQKQCIGKTGLVNSGFFTIENPELFPIDDRTKEFMLFELQKILEFNGFKSELLNNGSLQVAKELWSIEVENILQQMPFPDYLPHQINKAYEHHSYENHNITIKTANPNGELDYINLINNHPSRERLESIRQTIIDNTEGEL